MPEVAIIAAIFVIGVGMVWYAFIAPADHAAAKAAVPDSPPGPITQPAAPKAPPVREAAKPRAAVPANGGVTWPMRLDESAQDLTVATRLDLVERLGTIGAEWCADILAQAFREERESELRDAILASLIECAQRSSQGLFESALQSTRPTERAYAADGLATIGAGASAARALDDREEGVALAAAYALRRAGRGEFVDRYLQEHANDARAASIRKLMETLS